jgi:cysteine sulfinate desulfinase/cysteine desulfurase-like protein
MLQPRKLPIYLDHYATTPLNPRHAALAMIEQVT